MTFANMKYMYYLLSLLVVCLFGLSDMYAQQPIDYVNMRIGTDGEHRTEYGGTVPAVTTPFGMTQWCPVTRTTVFHGRCITTRILCCWVLWLPTNPLSGWAIMAI